MRQNDRVPSKPKAFCVIKPTPAAPGRPQALQSICFLGKTVASVTTPTPFAGPGDGLWPDGKAVPPPPSPAPVIPSCRALLLNECFADCNGAVPPDTVCGWEADGSAGVITFTPGQASIDGPPLGIIRARKIIPNAVDMLVNITGQYRFQEFDGNAPDVFYDISIVDMTGANGLDLTLVGDGLVYFQVGPNLAPAPFYHGTWTPNGGVHTVDYSVSPAGVPTIYIDGILIPMTFMGTQFNFANAPMNGINMEFERSNVGAPAILYNYFLTPGLLPPGTAFCCP